MEPRIDQAYFSSNVRDLVEADHWLPRIQSGQTLRNALETDRHSVLYVIGRPLYTGPQFSFEIVPFFLSSIILKVFGYSYSNIVALSILVSAAAVIPLAFLFRRCVAGSALTAVFPALFYATAAYSSLYSPWGVHNFGVLAFIGAIAIAASILKESASRGRSLYFIVTTLAGITLLAAYSHFTDVILVPIVMVFGLSTMQDRSAGVRMVSVALYGVIVLVGLAPVGLLALFLHQIHDNFLVYANVNTSLIGYLSALPERVHVWVTAGESLFSTPGMACGVAGLAWMGFTTRIWLPFLGLCAHFLCYCLVPGFIWNGSYTYLRTYNYAIPLLTVGIGWLLLRILQPDGGLSRNRFFRILTAACLIWHLLAQFSMDGYRGWARTKSYEFFVDYLQGQGEVRSVVSDIEVQVGSGELFFWDFPERFLYLSLGRRTANVSPSALTSILEKLNRGENVLFEMPTSVHVVAREGDAFSESKMLNAIQTLRKLPARMTPLARYPTLSYGTVLLYKVEFD